MPNRGLSPESTSGVTISNDLWNNRCGVYLAYLFHLLLLPYISMQHVGRVGLIEFTCVLVPFVSWARECLLCPCQLIRLADVILLTLENATCSRVFGVLIIAPLLSRIIRGLMRGSMVASGASERARDFYPRTSRVICL